MIIKNAYAKINLTLEIIKLLDNGLHEIKSIFQNISLHDELIFNKNKEKKIILKGNCSNIPFNEKNLIFKSVKAVQKYVNYKEGVSIELKKNIPICSGLGGGSSDAATTIIALNELWNLKLSTKEMISIANTIGSDVPFFIIGGTCLVKGTGEKIIKIKSIGTKKFLLFKPNINISTIEIYKYYDKIKKKYNIKKYRMTDKFIKSINKNLNFEKYYFNELEDIVLNLYPEIKEYIEIIKQNNGKVSMTGSGSAFFVYQAKNIDNIYNILTNKKIFVDFIYTI